MSKVKSKWLVVAGLAGLLSAGAVYSMSLLQERTILGAILDANCAKSFLTAENIEQSIADHHTIECTLSEISLKSGLVVMRGKTIVKIDPASNQVVIDFLKSPQAAQIARVTGTDGPNGFVVKSVQPSRER